MTCSAFWVSIELQEPHLLPPLPPACEVCVWALAASIPALLPRGQKEDPGPESRGSNGTVQAPTPLPQEGLCVLRGAGRDSDPAIRPQPAAPSSPPPSPPRIPSAHCYLREISPLKVLVSTSVSCPEL